MEAERPTIRGRDGQTVENSRGEREYGRTKKLGSSTPIFWLEQVFQSNLNSAFTDFVACSTTGDLSDL